jgi:hypothetical protein
VVGVAGQLESLAGEGGELEPGQAALVRGEDGEVQGQKLGWPAWTWIVLALAVMLAIATFQVERRRERRGDVPLLPPSVLRLPSTWRGLPMLLPFSIGVGAFMFRVRAHHSG